ncbi:Alpha-glucosidase [Euphorbia peplus]|nr:Alpha-glucosidase [Euphorbia peplus]
MSSSSLSLVASFLLVLVLVINGVNSSTPNQIGNGYKLISIEEGPSGGIVGFLEVKTKDTQYGPDIPLLQLFVKHETKDRLRVHITDAEKERWEVPYNLIPRPPALKQTMGSKKAKDLQLVDKENSYSGSQLIFSYTEDPFTFGVKRKSSGDTLFNSSAQLVFKDQYLEISTSLPEDASIYGFGESSREHGIKLYPNDPYTLWTTDFSSMNSSIDLYGSHPMYMDMRNVNGQGYAHSVLLLNSNGMDVFYTGTSLTYKVIGGVFDFYFFSGPTPLKVVDQYTELVGRPAAMPYWSFGFHQCKWGYHNISIVEDVVNNYIKEKIPLDVMWTDDDHMDFHKDFTLDPIMFPKPKMTAFLERLHGMGMKYIVLIDPGIAVNSSYGVYQRGVAQDVFIKHNGKPYVGQVWPGGVNFPDFLNPKTVEWWVDEIRRFHEELLAVDGLWIDMNEISNFCWGDCTIPEGKKCPDGKGPGWVCCLDCKNVTYTKWDTPPYKINASGVQAPIGYKTIATSAVHYNGVLEYDAHNIYGFTQAIATHKALQGIKGKRPFVLTRSSFVGTGKYAAHWTGDNEAKWIDMNFSISTMLNFGLFGIPMVGSDICGFFPGLDANGKMAFPDEEMCSRWIELGAFYPFARAHSSFLSPRQELYRWKGVAISARNALGMRYKLLPHIYTLSYEAHLTGAPIARPLFFSFPNFTECYGLSDQFLLGSSLLVSPVLEQGKTEVKALFPPGSWYNIFDMTQTISSKKGEYVTLAAPLNVINVHLFENTIVPMQQGGFISKDARKTPFTLIVSFPAGASKAEAKGNLFLDDDELPEMKLASGTSTYVDFYASVSDGTVKIWSKVKEGKFALESSWTIENVITLGLDGSGKPSGLEVNKEKFEGSSTVKVSSSEHKYLNSVEEDKKSVMVDIKGLAIQVGNDFSMTWKMS